jgi:hypothetical protein
LVPKVSISMLIPNGASTDNARPPSLLRFCGLVEYCTAKHGTRSLLICEPVSHWSAASIGTREPNR